MNVRSITDRFLIVSREHSAARIVHAGHHLIGDYDGNTELVRQPLQVSQELAEVHLSTGQLPATTEIGSVQGGRTVHNQQRVTRFAHHRRRLDQQVHLMVGVVGACAGDVVEHALHVQLVAAGRVHQTLRTKGALGVDVETLA